MNCKLRNMMRDWWVSAKIRLAFFFFKELEKNKK